VANKNRYLILGGSGFLGKYFVANLHNSALVHTSGRNRNQEQGNQIRLEITKYSESDLEKIFYLHSFSHVINCVALADIELCERFPEKADWLNRALPNLLARQSIKHSFKLVHISTDAVFDGSKPNRTEEDSPKPTNVYSATKYKGELEVLDLDPSALIARVNFVGQHPTQKSLFDFFQQNLSARKSTKGYSNVYFTPLWATETVRIVIDLVSKSKSGIFHIAGSNRISKYEFGCLVADRLNIPRSYIEPIEFSNSKGAPVRSLDLSLSNAKLKKTGIELQEIEESLKAFMHADGLGT
jgi:dTDP-4-dehydrorhamnose reductase